MVRFLICFVLVLNMNFVLAAQYNNISRNYAHNNWNRYYQAISPRDLSALEKYTLNRTFAKDSPLHRLERLENLAFGSVQTGNIEERYQNVERVLLSRPVNRPSRSRLGNIVNYFAGQPTGITPSIIPNNDYYNRFDNVNTFNHYPSYGTQRIDQFSNGIFGSGYRLMNSGFGSGSGITILP